MNNGVLISLSLHGFNIHAGMQNPYRDQKCHVMMILGNLVYLKFNKRDIISLNFWGGNEKEKVKGKTIFYFSGEAAINLKRKKKHSKLKLKNLINTSVWKLWRVGRALSCNLYQKAIYWYLHEVIISNVILEDACN